MINTAGIIEAQAWNGRESEEPSFLVSLFSSSQPFVPCSYRPSLRSSLGWFFHGSWAQPCRPQTRSRRRGSYPSDLLIFSLSSAANLFATWSLMLSGVLLCPLIEKKRRKESSLQHLRRSRRTWLFRCSLLKK
ncbi:hypothetical protein HPP92_026906 [Vanilla planifolia]|uniref:Uncharacterized protein n=1 Tax=Vanilla planifolia TaxID=51239 RepID=A0A835U6G2_VANPL|nr:hypothetical protein HPP92_026906 [Vanilla planifolia]